MANASTRQIASVDRYANALFQLAKEAKVLETVSSELLNLKKILNEDDILPVSYTHLTLPTSV